MKSISSISQNLIEEKWYIVDAEGKRIGLIASKVAEVLQGKLDRLVRDYHEPKIHVVVVNAAKIDYTPKRGMTKFYKNYSGFPGGLKFQSLDEVMRAHPDRPIETAIRGMLPKTKQADKMMANLRIYSGAEHEHTAQSPVVLDLKKLSI
ncbi:MAG: 50S ribosomal protein L13 [Candidatus Dojkabacteria bacterium]